MLSINKKGFTIVEFMIAITIFTAAIMLVMGAVIFIGKQYQRGSKQVDLEDAARTIHQNISDAIKYSGADSTNFAVNLPTPPNSLSYMCIGNATYYFPENSADPNPNGLNSITYTSAATGLLAKYNSTCNEDTTDAINLLPAGAKVAKISVKDDNNDGIYEIYTNFISAEPDLVDFDPLSLEAKCRDSVSGREFCANTSITSYASRRTN